MCANYRHAKWNTVIWKNKMFQATPHNNSVLVELLHWDWKEHQQLRCQCSAANDKIFHCNTCRQGLNWYRFIPPSQLQDYQMRSAQDNLCCRWGIWFQWPYSPISQPQAMARAPNDPLSHQPGLHLARRGQLLHWRAWDWSLYLQGEENHLKKKSAFGLEVPSRLFLQLLCE